MRDIELVVISDVHLGTVGCRAGELLNYLGSIRPQTLVLNGDIFDIWQFKKHYWPDTHRQVIKRLIELITDGTQVYYLTGNHDDLLRKYSPIRLGNFKLCDKLVLELGEKKAWFFHGDIFDVTMGYSKWLGRLGAIGYDFLIILNRLVNFWSEKMGRGRFSFSKRIKDSVKKAVQYISDFEKVAAEMAIENGYDFVICGHIHHPEIRSIQAGKEEVVYMNSGDWIENLSSLEFDNGVWTLYRYEDELANVRQQGVEPQYLNREDPAELLDMEYVSEQMRYIIEGYSRNG